MILRPPALAVGEGAVTVSGLLVRSVLNGWPFELTTEAELHKNLESTVFHVKNQRTGSGRTEKPFNGSTHLV